MGGYLNFLWAGLMKQGQTGALIPSQRFLIARMTAPVPSTYRGRIVELGAGTGAITLSLAAKCPLARILACEINPTLARDNRFNLVMAGLSERVDVVPDSAERLLGEMARRAADKPQFIISSIPLGNLNKERVLQLLDAIGEALAPDGCYVQYQHSLLDRKKIRSKFPNLRTIPVFLNFPPAVVHYARR